MAEAIVEVLFENLSSFIQKELGLFLGINQELKRLSSILSTIRTVLEDAEEKQFSDRAIQNWLQKLKDVVHVLDDILDKCAISESQNKVPRSCFSSFYPKHVLFRHKISHQMKKIREALDEIAEERRKFHLCETVSGVNEVEEWRQTTSIITQPKMYGREMDKLKVVDFLVEQANSIGDVLSVYPIVGIGGIGKTTLAQIVFNDERVMEHFELRIWVCVSENFNLKRISKSIIESTSGHSCEALDLDPSLKRLQETLQRKRYLLVLDDVWNENQEKWDKLKYVLACGLKGSSIIVTTRLTKVAAIMGAVSPHQLSGLSIDDCWALFEQRAFGLDKKRNAELEAIGKDILKKCAGVPLAVKSLGGLLRFKRTEREWLSVKESKLWSLPQDETSVLPALRLSYWNLPIKLRQCFAYCGIFPKSFKIDKNLLIHLWMANGFICSSAEVAMEDIGDEIFNELFWRSFFQDIERDIFGNIICFKMHDLVHDLAQSVMGETCCTMENGSLTVSSRTQHVSFTSCNEQLANPLNSLEKVKHLRTYLLLSGTSPYSVYEVMKFTSLRALHMGNNMGLAKFPSSVINLKHLRYLNLSHGNFKTLPNSLCSLWYLQVLNLDDCRALQKLPNHMRYLRALRHLFLRRCTSLYCMPPKMGQLTCLRTLNIYTIGSRKGFLLDELKHLNLKGELHIKHLERIRSVMDAKEVNLASKDLEELLLSWSRSDELELQQNVDLILEALKPNLKLKILGIGGYKGVHFPQWMANPTLDYLCSLYIVDCKNCSQLPPLHKLPSLKGLTLHNLNLLRYINDETFDAGVLRGMRSLEYLMLGNLPNLEGLSKEEGEQMFPCLCTVYIGTCPKLALPCLPSVKELLIPRCNGMLLGSIHNLRGLQSLWLCFENELTSFPDARLGDLTSLMELHFCSCTKLRILPSELSSLCGLEELHIETCYELESLPEQILQGLHSLQRLNIGWCNKLKFLSDGFQYLSSLKELRIVSCPEVSILPESLQWTPSLQSLSLYGLPNLAVLPDWLGSLTSLQSLEISDCPLLKFIPMSFQCISNLKCLNISACPELLRRCEKESGEDWQKIAHIPHVNLNRGKDINPMMSLEAFPINLRVEDPFLSKTIKEHENAMGRCRFNQRGSGQITNTTSFHPESRAIVPKERRRQVPSKIGGQPEKKEVLLVDTDSVWLELRHAHIADASERLPDKFTNFCSKNKAAQIQQSGRDGSEFTTRDLQKMVQALPQYTEQVEKISLHVELARLSPEDMKVIQNMQLLAGSSKTKSSAGSFSLKFNNQKTKHAARKDRSEEAEETWQLFRFYPVLEELIENLNKGQVSKSDYSCLNEPTPTPQSGSVRSSQRAQTTTPSTAPHSMRSRRTANWAKPRHSDDGYSSDSVLKNACSDFKRMGKRIFVFIIGGAARSELRVCHKMTTKLRREVILGSSSLDEPPQYITKLKLLCEPQPPMDNHGLGLGI